LTLVGYSVNDTIVVFDRIREVCGKYGVPVASRNLVKPIAENICLDPSGNECDLPEQVYPQRVGKK
jgi:hypothetical protein